MVSAESRRNGARRIALVAAAGRPRITRTSTETQIAARPDPCKLQDRAIPSDSSMERREEKRGFRPVENPRAKSVISASSLVDSEGAMGCSRHWIALSLCVAYMHRRHR